MNIQDQWNNFLPWNFIGKYETLNEDAEQILIEIGVSDRVKFPAAKTNGYAIPSKSLMNDYFSTIDNRTIEEIYKIFENDFIAFGYRKPVIQFKPTVKKYNMSQEKKAHDNNQK